MTRSARIIILITLAFLAAFLIYPVGRMLADTFMPSGQLSHKMLLTVLNNPSVREGIINSLLLAVTVTLVTALIAIPLAVITVRFRFPGKQLLSALLLVPMIMPPFVGAIGMKQILARFGSVNLLLMDLGIISGPIDWLGGNQFWGIVIIEALHLFPIFMLNTAAALANVDRSLEDASENLGASPWRTFCRITVPLMLPGLFAGSIVVFIWAFTDLGTPLIFEYRRVAPVLIFDRVTEASDNPEGSAIVVWILLITLAAFLLARRCFGSSSVEMMGKGVTGSTEKTVPWYTGLALSGAMLFVILIALLPHAAVILSSVKASWFMTVLPESYTAGHYQNSLSHPLTLPSIQNSIWLSIASTAIDVVLGIAIAWVLARRHFRGASLFDAMVMLPLAIPGLILAFGYVTGFAGTPLDPRNNPFPLLIIAYSVRRLPYTVRTIYSGFQQVSVTLEEAAVNLGSSAFTVLRRITLPLISANILAGAILAFSFAMLEVSDSLILALKEKFYPLTKAIYALQGRIEDGPYIASALGVWSMIFLALALIIAGRLLGKRMGQMFRM
jgi:iron(III) transport system permease protein